jgi:NAD(P)-dependent dehydrogenase (short-subunit alcohol dehydrogenase family)
MSTNLDAAFYLDRATIPGMLKRNWGRIIHISGYDGFTGHVPRRAHNVSCKAGLHGLTKAIAQEFGSSGITANTVVPGAIETERDFSQLPAGFVKSFEERVAVKRWGQVDEIAEACLFLVGENSGFITGQAIHINGGEFMF